MKSIKSVEKEEEQIYGLGTRVLGSWRVLWGLLKRVEKALMTCPDAQPISDLIVYIFKD